MTDDNDAPARIWLEPACVPCGERCWSEDHPGDCCEEGCEMPAIEYVRADIAPPAPTDAEVEAAAKAILASMTENAETVMRYLSEHGAGVIGHLLDTDDNPGQRLRDDIDAARAALLAGRKGRE